MLKIVLFMIFFNDFNMIKFMICFFRFFLYEKSMMKFMFFFLVLAFL